MQGAGQRSAIRLLRTFLRTHGYREETIISDYRTDTNRSRPLWIDTVVVDSLSGTPLLAFEIQATQGAQTDPRVIQTLERVSNAFQPIEVLTYLAIVNPERSTVQIWEFVSTDQHLNLVNTNLPDFSGDTPSVRPHEPPSPESLSSFARLRLRMRRDRSLKSLRVVSSVLSVLALTVAALDFFLGLGVSTTQVTLVGIAILLWIVPHANKVSVMGVELDMLGKSIIESTREPEREESS